MRSPTKKSWLSTLLGKLGEPQREPEPSATLRPFQAVSIYRGVQSCEQARELSDCRFLVREAPALPLDGCTMRDRCRCKYLKHKDRRGQSRRLIDFGVAPRLFDGTERRLTRGRRATD